MKDKTFQRVDSNNPCVHCQKPDWCYSIGKLTVCCRDNIADGWYKTTKHDDDGHYYLAPVTAKKDIAPKGRTTYQYLGRKGSPLVEVIRTDDGEGNKDVYQRYFNGKKWLKSLKNCPSEQIPIYRYGEIRSAIASGATEIFIVEGEKCADRLWEIGLLATTTIRGLAKWLPEHTADLAGIQKVILCPDRDRLSLKKMSKVAEALNDSVTISWLYAPPSDFYWQSQNLPPDNGSDVADWLKGGATKKQILAALRDTPLRVEHEEAPRVEETEDNFTQQAYQALYGQHSYIAIAGELYSWNGNYYARLLASEEKRRIAQWCQSTPIPKRGGGYKYNLATTAKVEEIYKWALLLNGVDPSQINPSGINCKNGVVDIQWDGKTPRYELLQPDPRRYYTYCADIKYSPGANSEHCDKLLAALEPPQQEIFLKTIAASFDLNKVRKYNSGNIKALLLQGTGSNGKDSLWQAVHAIVGETMTQISFSDFQEYDKGRKFNVARLETAKICWASENSEFISLDNVQVLKQAITGEKLAIEQKNAPAYLMDINSVFLFNVNQAPLITAGLEAISRRYAVLDFNKTYCKDANPALGQIEADPRFRYDPEFLNTEVAPALLNYLLDALAKVVTEGIDYSCCESSLEKIKKSSNHLWEFVEDVGLTPDPNGQVYLKDIWQLLEQWYLDNEILTIENGQRYWQSPVRKGDEYVKASRMLYSKLKNVFPHIQKVKSTTRGTANKAMICGIAQLDPFRQTFRLITPSDMVFRQVEANRANYSEIEFLLDSVHKLTQSQRLELQEYLENLNSQNFADQNGKNGENRSISNIANLPKLASTPPPFWLAA